MYNTTVIPFNYVPFNKTKLNVLKQKKGKKIFVTLVGQYIDSIHYILL